MSFFLKQTIDFARHNDEVRELWAAFTKQEHSRVPVMISGSIRNLLANPAINQTGYTFPELFTSVGAQIACGLAYQHYCAHHMICDRQMGVPEAWGLNLDFQNSYDQAWFGCPMRYFGPYDTPDTVEILKDNPDDLDGWDDPDPIYGRGDIVRRAMDMLGEMRARCAAGLEFFGKPVNPPAGLPWAGGDGVFTIALKLRGMVELMVDMYERPDYFGRLMDYVTRNTIRRMKAFREWAWAQDPSYKGDRSHRGRFFYADDSIALLSCEQYERFILPYHQRVFEEFHDGSGSGFHLCGDATRHFPRLVREFNAKAFDTGFPVDHGALRRTLGPGIEIWGGPTVMLVQAGPTAAVAEEARRICQSGVLDGKRFVMIAANNLAPCTPVENIQALYDAVRQFGRYDWPPGDRPCQR